MPDHTALSCTVESHDHYGQIDAVKNGTGAIVAPEDDKRTGVGNPTSFWAWVPTHTSSSLGTGEDELVCSDCFEPMFYDTTDESYHHTDPDAAPCFLIPRSGRTGRKG